MKKFKAVSNDKALVKTDGKWSVVLAEDETKKLYKNPPEYRCPGTDKDGNECLARILLKISSEGNAYFSVQAPNKHKEGCEYDKSRRERHIHPKTNNISLVDMENYFGKFSTPSKKRVTPPNPGPGGPIAPKPKDSDEDDEDYIEIVGNPQLPRSLSSLYEMLCDNIGTKTHTANGILPEDIIVNSETFFDFLSNPDKLDNKAAIVVGFFKRFLTGAYTNAPVVNGYPAFTFVYPNNQDKSKTFHFCISFANKEIYDFFKNKYLDQKGKKDRCPMLIFGNWKRIKTADSDIVFHTTITSIKMLGRIKDDYLEKAEKDFLN